MAKLLDFIFLKLAIFILLFVWLLCLVDFWWAIALASLGFLIINLILSKKNLKAKKQTADDAQKQLLLLGNEGVLSLFLKKDVAARYAISANTLTYCAFKAAKVVVDEIAQTFILAKNNNLDRVVLLCNQIDRAALLFADTLPIQFEIVDFKKLYSLLKKENRLPQTIDFKKPRFEIKLAAIAKAALSKRAMLYYLFSGATLATFAFITPLKLYYLIMASVSLALAIAAVLYNVNGG